MNANVHFNIGDIEACSKANGFSLLKYMYWTKYIHQSGFVDIVPYMQQ